MYESVSGVLTRQPPVLVFFCVADVNAVVGDGVVLAG
jgi:hypothetical protein